MSKHNSGKRKLKYVFLAAACAVSFSLTGLVAACNDNNDDDDDDEKTTSVEDTQLLKNGNFEYFTVPDDAVYLIKTPLNWTSGGTSSYTMSGIIGTSEKAWSALTSAELAATLDANNDLDPDDSDYKDKYVDYNGMTSNDLLYKDVKAALSDDATTDDPDEADPKTDFIANPGTHYNVQKDTDGSLYYLGDQGERVEVYEDEDGDYFLDEEYKQGISNILMLHNYKTGDYANGISQYYSSASITLPANTAAEISFWVKTGYLRFNDYSEVTENDFNRGANVNVIHTVGSTTLDNFAITSINTEKLIAENAVEDSNGWVEYTVYVNACDFAESTVTLQLGLGETDALVAGYAFFDDVSVTKYVSLDDSSYPDYADTISAAGAYCTLSAEDNEKIFNADSYSKNNGAVTDKRFSESVRYLLDLASEEDYSPVTFASSNTSAGLTVDGDNYVSSTSSSAKLIGLTSLKDVSGAKLPSSKFTALNTTDDLIAVVSADHSFTAEETSYYGELNGLLEKAVNLPKFGDAAQNNMIVVLSAYGAAYTSSVQLSIDANGYQIISFWVKTSDMDGSTAATVSVTQDGKKSNTASISVDSTDVTTAIDDDNKDIYNGWVQCFFFVSNDTEKACNYTVDFSFGNTTIKDTTSGSYKGGWVALANMQTLDVSEDTFSLTGSGSYVASLSVTETEDSSTSVFDDAYGSEANNIKNGIVNPSNYIGVNGGSSNVVDTGVVSLPFDDSNTNDYAGLINREYFENYYGNNAWMTMLLQAFNVNWTDATSAWNEIFGSSSVQPLIILNKTRTDLYVAVKDATADNFTDYWIKNDDGTFTPVSSLENPEYDENTTYYTSQYVSNYGFIGSSKTVSADSYTTVTVKVKVSTGAVAYIYLTDSSSDKSVLSFSAPKYTFFYDEDGNVIKEELDDDATIAQKRANIVYTLRDDGLYEDKDGKLYANVYNYYRLYKDQTIAYYDAVGNRIGFDDLRNDTVYYDENGAAVNCYLVTADNEKVYEFRNGKYYYMVDGKASSEVTPFDTQYARYDYSELDEKHLVVVDGNDQNVANKWITVSFAIHTGSESKSYRLELWSGAREQYGDNIDDNANPTAVLFDYSYASISSSNYDSLRSEYEKDIILAYKNLLIEKNLVTGFASSSENISYFEELARSFIGNGITQTEFDEIYNSYTAYYYMYTLYDSANYVPFNLNTADENATGYDYTITDYSESLAYLSVKDDLNYTVFVDYSTVDQSISLGTSGGDTDDDTDDDTDGTTVWLLISSIVLVIALLFTMISIFIRDVIKKARRKKTYGKNNYTQRNRYIRKLRINKQEFEEVDGGKAEDGDNAENAAEETADVQSGETPSETDDGKSE